MSAALPDDLAQMVTAAAASLYRDALCATLAAAGAVVWVKIFNTLASNGALDQVCMSVLHCTAC